MNQTQTDQDLSDWLALSKEIENDVYHLKSRLDEFLAGIKPITPEHLLKMNQELRFLNRLAKVVWRNIFDAQNSKV